MGNFVNREDASESLALDMRICDNEYETENEQQTILPA